MMKHFSFSDMSVSKWGISVLEIALTAVLWMMLLAGPFVQAGDNILLIIADDMGIEQLAAYGVSSDPPNTPNLNALVETGVRFENAWSNPVCSPTRAGIFSGRHGFRTGVGHVVLPNGNNYLSLDEFILPEALALGGYQTGLIGKWHVGNEYNGGEDGPNLAGFNHFSGLLEGKLDDYYSWPRTQDGITETIDEYSTTVIVDDALNWIGKQAGPWATIVAFNAPHSPFHAPPDHLHSVNLEGLDPDVTPLPFYKAAIEAMDTEIGRLLSSLGDELEQTTIIFIGDNGTPGEVVEEPLTSSKAKGTVYQGGVNVPLILNGPEIPHGEVRTGLAHTLDLYATMIELAGLQVENTVPEDVVLDAVSLLNYAKDGASTPRPLLYTETFEEDGSYQKAVRNRRYKVIDLEGVFRFYDLFNDPYENVNLLTEGSLSTYQSTIYSRLRTYISQQVP